MFVLRYAKCLRICDCLVFQCKTELNEQKAAFSNMKRKWEFVESQYQAEIDAKERKVSYPQLDSTK